VLVTSLYFIELQVIMAEPGHRWLLSFRISSRLVLSFFLLGCCVCNIVSFSFNTSIGKNKRMMDQSIRFPFSLFQFNFLFTATFAQS